VNFETINRNLAMTIDSLHLTKTTLPLCPQIELYLIAADYPQGRLDQAEMLAILDSPAYWAFCWASGQVLAAYILAHPYEFKEQTILDFGCGSGVVAIAAAMSGARRVIACDIDPMALDAARTNAELNQVEIDYLANVDDLNVEIDTVIAADVLYDRDNMSFLKLLPEIANNVVIADSRVKEVELHGYHLLDRQEATTIPDLDEYKEFNDVKIYRAN
jgi:predicted nicotinamide N-methyase